MATRLFDEKRVECKYKLTRNYITIICIFGFFFLFFLCSAILIFVSDHEMLWGILIPIAISLYLFIKTINRPVYIFTNEEVRKRMTLLPFIGEKVVLRYSDIDRYYSVYCNFNDSKVIGGKPYMSFVNAAEYWFVKGDKAVFILSKEYQNQEEMKKLLPIPYAGEAQLSRSQYEKHEIRGAILREEMENMAPVSLGQEVYVEAQGNPFSKPGCLGWMTIFLWAPLLVCMPIEFYLGNTNEDSLGASLVMVVCGVLWFLFVFWIGRKSGWITIDERNGVIILKSFSKPFRKNKVLPFEEVSLVHIDRKENMTIIYDINGIWCKFRHFSFNNFDKVYAALLVLKAKGKLKVEEK